MDSKNKKTILVPWDFTPAAENALLHAVSLGKKFDNNVTLLHIADRGKSLSNNSKKIQETIAATNKLNELTRQYSEKCKICINSIVIEGSIFTTIADVASQLDVSLICMGTHGMKGMQKITGSWAMKVISSTDIPFYVVQAPPSKQDIKNIIFPVDENKETAEKLTWGKFLTTKLDASIRIVKQHFEGGTKVSSNMAFVNKYLKNHEIEFDIYEPPKTKNFIDSMISYASKKEPCMILIMVKRGINITDYIMGLDEQKLIFNQYKIPVMCINHGNKAK
ncbi:MAG: hypothetical protein A2309_07910 [Bacteroidetes bacterium RIFOXYB2_FULL_35_7]|nr:MAG: hypothetical protein A2X01_15570 [Bacteroidetes bacterium GWF2_35_48]OFY94354.1 MAG: hypothetical protein A2491_00570 [Bacteroidetes bacterium RIFOXYC12_FULL_35_7]OFY97026.1 MAG: hypothetical protein A2309_07910 [Bacteroidetes bacterium RIFOXYB2_FULL_35_7]HBX49867.1 hypothetical protein [Bacteroidales bacterium]